MKKLENPFEIIKESWNIFTDKKNFLPLVKIYLPSGIFTLAMTLMIQVPATKNIVGGGTGTIITNILSFLLLVFVNLAGIQAVIEITKGNSLSVKSVLKNALSDYPRFLVFSVLIYFIYALGMVLWVIPFLIAATWLSFSIFIFVEKRRGIVVSLKESIALVKGRFWKVLGRMTAFMLFPALSLFVLWVVPFGLGLVAFNLIGALFILPPFLLYKEISSVVNG